MKRSVQLILAFNPKQAGAMDRIDNMMFRTGHQFGIWCAREEIERIKEVIGFHLKIGHERLNEIAIEDIEIEIDSQQRVYGVLYDLAMAQEISRDGSAPDAENPGVPCTGFWIEDSLDLILYAWNGSQSRTIVIPQSEWFLRDDIVIH